MVSIFVDGELVFSLSGQPLEVGSDLGVSAVGAVSWLVKVGPAPEVRAVGGIKPNVGAVLFCRLLN